MTGTLVFDADCGFCTASAEWATRHVECVTAPWQSLDLDAVGLSEDDVTTAAYWLVDGQPPQRGARAVSAAMRQGHRLPLRVLGRVIDARPVRPLAAWVYGLVARYRYKLPGGTNACKIR